MINPRVYVKKPIQVEALELTEGMLPREIRKFYPEAVTMRHPDTGALSVIIKTLEGPVTAGPGYFIVKGVAGEYWPVRPDIFHQTYDRVPMSYEELGPGELNDIDA